MNSYSKHIYCTILILIGSISSYGQLVTNNGALISVKTGAVVMVKTGSVNNTNAGTFDNAGTVTVEGNFENNALANGGGTAGVYRVQGNWINNSVFTADLSQVELYGTNQLITGTSVTEFHRLTLTGTGIKTQTINSRVNNLLELNDRELATGIFKMFVLNPNTNAITRTTGFVSSLGLGRLVRTTNSSNNYLFPVGSSLGVNRYRPIEIKPSTIAPQELEVRLANVDATTEGYDRSIRENAVCDVNGLYYHLIGRLSGTADVQINFYFDPIADGAWSGIGHWQGLPQWENTGAVTTTTAPPFSVITVPSWNNFTLEPFALINLGPLAAITGNISLCAGFGTSINFNGTPNATVTYTVNGGALQTIVLDATGFASINTGNLLLNTQYNLVSASTPGPPLCSQSFTTSVLVTILPSPSLSPLFHD